MEDSYIPPRVWSFVPQKGSRFSDINRPTAGPRSDRVLPRGEHPLQLYSLGTPNGVKVTILLEELLESGVSDAEYDAFIINITEGDQFTKGFVEINPNSKIPALVDYSMPEPLSVFESGSILLYLAEKYSGFLPGSPAARTRTLNWLFWLQGSAPFLGGGFGHFYRYAEEKQEYPIDRFSMEVKRQLDVLNRHFRDSRYAAGDDYTIADMAIFPWYGGLVLGNLYDASEFLAVKDYTHVLRWAGEIQARPAVKRGSVVNVVWGPEEARLKERHSARDFDGLKLQ